MTHLTPNNEPARQALTARAARCREFNVKLTWRDEVQFMVGFDAAYAHLLNRMRTEGAMKVLRELNEHVAWHEPRADEPEQIIDLDKAVFSRVDLGPMPFEELFTVAPNGPLIKPASSVTILSSAPAVDGIYVTDQLVEPEAFGERIAPAELAAVSPAGWTAPSEQVYQVADEEYFEAKREELSDVLSRPWAARGAPKFNQWVCMVCTQLIEVSPYAIIGGPRYRHVPAADGTPHLLDGDHDAIRPPKRDLHEEPADEDDNDMTEERIILEPVDDEPVPETPEQARIRELLELEYTACKHCGERVQLVRFAMGPEWLHLPTPYGNYRTNELYRHCRNTTSAEPVIR